MRLKLLAPPMVRKPGPGRRCCRLLTTVTRHGDRPRLGGPFEKTGWRTRVHGRVQFRLRL